MAYLTALELADVDKTAITSYHMDVLLLMENSGFAVATLAKRILGGNVAGRNVTCLVGNGNNGGDGLVAARRLLNWGAKILVILGGEATDLHEIPVKQLRTLEKMGVRAVGPEGDFGKPDLIIDALLGYNSIGNPREPVAGLIRRANGLGVRILAVDIPSGLDVTAGYPMDPCITAKATLTFGFPKTGFLNPESYRFVGELYVGDVSLPAKMYEERFATKGLFSDDIMVRLR